MKKRKLYDHWYDFRHVYYRGQSLKEIVKILGRYKKHYQNVITLGGQLSKDINNKYIAYTIPNHYTKKSKTCGFECSVCDKKQKGGRI